MNRHYLASTLAVALLLWGCAKGNDPDAGAEADVIEAGGGVIPFSIELSVSPGRAAYHTDATINVIPTVLTEAGDQIVDSELVFTFDPQESATELEAGRYTLLKEGRIAFRACTVDLNADGAPICDVATIFVDDGSPMLSITSPVPGAELGGDGATAITVEGSVADMSADLAVFVNGKRVELSETGSFTTEVTPFFGANHIEVSASDGVTNASRLEMDVLWAESYAPSTGDNPTVQIDPGISVQLAQSFFDDNSRLDPAATPVKTADLADLFELILSRIDFASVLPNPVVDNPPAFVLRIPSVTTGDISVTIDLVEGGADLFVRIGQLDAETDGELRIDTSRVSLTGRILSSMSAYGRLNITKENVTDPLSVTLEGLTVALESAEGRFVSEEANAVFRLAEGLLRNTIEDRLLEAFRGTLADALPSILLSALGSLDTALRDQTIEINQGIFPAMSLLIDGRLSNVTVRPGKSLLAPLRMQVGTNKSNLHPESRGVATLSSGSDPLFEMRPVQIGADVTLMNGILHSLWASGLLSIDATTILPEGVRGVVENAELEGKMTPVLRPKRPGESGDMVLSVGQLELSLTTLGDRTVFGISLESEITLDLTDNKVSLILQETPSIRVWIIESDSPSPLVDEESLKSILLTQLWPQLSSAVSDGLKVGLPDFSLANLATLAPSLSALDLSFELNGPLDVRESKIVIDAKLVGTLP